MLRDDDVLTGLLMAAPAGAHGAHLPGAGTNVHVHTGTPSDEASMIAYHEAAHLGLNHLTAFGLMLQVMGAESLPPKSSPTIHERLSAMVDLCRNTHEVFATTSGVWRSTADFDGALTSYPAYKQYFDAGRSLAGSLREGSFAAHTAVECACWAAMQAPVGELLHQHGVEGLTSELVPENLRPDVRLNVLLDAHLDPRMLDVALPAAWRDKLMVDGDLDVSDLYAAFIAVASAYYHAFREVLVEAGLPTFAFDEHKSDPALRSWLEVHPPQVAGPILSRPGADGIDRFWTVAISDAERVVVWSGRPLIAVHFGDLPTIVGGHPLGHESFAVGEEQDSSILVIVRPLQTLLKQYQVDPDSAALLRAAATDGIVTAVRAEASHQSGEIVTVLGILDSRVQLDMLLSVPAVHGVLASVSEASTWFPAWSNYWLPALTATSYVVRLLDFPRRLWLDGLEREGCQPLCQPISIGSEEGVSGGLSALAVFFGSAEDPIGPPILVVGTAHTANAVESALTTIFGPETVDRHGLPAPQAKFAALAQRLVVAEPWFDARSLEDLPDFAKMGEHFRHAGRIVRRE